MPGDYQQKLAGYADDTSIIVRDNHSLTEINRIILDFELATGSKLNRNNKTKIFGVGQWNGLSPKVSTYSHWGFTMVTATKQH